MAYPRETLDMLRMRMLERRRILVESAQRGSREIESLKSAERNAEMEEGAQTASAEYVLTQLADGQRREVAQLDAALSRIDAGTYGVCIDCGANISVERLRAMPYALRDAGCESRKEADELGSRGMPSL